MGGTGGGNTITGLRFEKTVDLYAALRATGRFTFEEIFCLHNKKRQRCGIKLFENGVHKASLARQEEFARFIECEYGVVMKKRLTWSFEPDDGLVLISSPLKVFIVETKFQQTKGSVDEKPSSCHYRQERWTHLFAGTDLGKARVQLIYVLSSWFLKPKYKDMIAYVKSQGCLVFINEPVPMDVFGL